MKTALITGACRGLGAEITKQLRSMGWLVYSTSVNPIDREVIFMDVTNRASVKSVKVRADIQSMDLLVNNAGIFPEKDTILNSKEESLRNFIEVNSIGPIVVTQEFWELLKSVKGKVINITSRRGQCNVDTATRANYSLSKNMLNHITRLFSIEGKEFGISVNAICPGHFRSDMGGDHAPQSVEEAAAHVLWLYEQDVTGKLFLGREEANW